MDVKLIMLVKPPCSSPCWFEPTWLVAIPCMAGPVMAPKAPGTIARYIIHDEIEKLYPRKAMIVKDIPMMPAQRKPVFGIIHRIRK